jgi:hypothetical protein
VADEVLPCRAGRSETGPNQKRRPIVRYHRTYDHKALPIKPTERAEKRSTVMDISSSRFREALAAAGLTANHKSLLRAHYRAPEHKITARQMARAARYKGYSGANRRLWMAREGARPEAGFCYQRVQSRSRRDFIDNEHGQVVWVMKP